MSVGQSQDEIFEVGIQLHRAARALHLISERFDIPQTHLEDFDLLEPGPLHLPFEISQNAAGVHEELVALADQLIRASKLTMADLEIAWRSKTEKNEKKRSAVVADDDSELIDEEEFEEYEFEEDGDGDDEEGEDGEDGEEDGDDVEVIEIKRNEVGKARIHVKVT